MPYVIASPEIMTSAAADIETIGSTLDGAHNAAAPMTLAVLPAAADEVSAGIAHLFSQYAEDYQGLARKAAAYQQQFVQNLKTSGVAYASVEEAIASLLDEFRAGVNSIATVLATPELYLFLLLFQGLAPADPTGGGRLLALFILFPILFLPAATPNLLFNLIIDKFITALGQVPMPRVDRFS